MSEMHSTALPSSRTKYGTGKSARYSHQRKTKINESGREREREAVGTVTDRASEAGLGRLHPPRTRARIPIIHGTRHRDSDEKQKKGKQSSPRDKGTKKIIKKLNGRSLRSHSPRTERRKG